MLGLGAGVGVLAFLFGVTIATRFGVLAWALEAACFVAFAAAWIIPTRTHVGADGVLTRWLWIERFFPAGEIANAERYTVRFKYSRVVGVELTMRNGCVERIPVGPTHFREERAASLLARIRQVSAETTSPATDRVAVVSLARGNADVPRWIEQLRRIGSGANVTHRVAPTSPEALLGVVEDARADACDRAAAAVALGPSLPPELRRRVAAVAADTAAPRLRVALQCVADGADDAKLEEAFEALAGDATSPRAMRR